MELNYQQLSSNHRITKTDKYWNYTDDQKFLDPLCGNTSFIFGYNNKAIMNSMIDVQSRVGFLRGTSNESCEDNDTLISNICQRGSFDSLTWAVSGSDGVEAAVYINDEYWKNLKKDKPTIITFSPGYHGTTYLAKIFREEYASNDRAVVISRLDNDLDTLNLVEDMLKVNSKIGAVLIESAPWNGGLRLWSDDWWINIKQLCNKYEINFIVDDVLGGVGKLGYYFSHQRYNVQPDIVALGKSLTGGYSPLSCACTTKKITDVVKHTWNFGHTWAPNMGGVGAALEVDKIFDTIDFFYIERELCRIGKSLKNKNLIDGYDVAGLLFYLTLDKEYPIDALLRARINGNINDSNGIFICAPAIADLEYFTELEKRLLLAL
jgi:adenosylmethionine-8-amino-7-oxononanoate aminotransferase